MKIKIFFIILVLSVMTIPGFGLVDTALADGVGDEEEWIMGEIIEDREATAIQC